MSEEWLAEIALDGAVNTRRMYQWVGITSAIALTSSHDARFVATSVNRLGFSSGLDVFARSLSPLLLPADPHLVTASGTLQSNVEIAAGVNGYAVTWAEVGPDNSAHVYVRRFSPGGVPQDVTPLAVLTLAYEPQAMYSTRAKIASNGETYVLGWLTTPGFVIRRFDARTGSWIDSQPVLLPMQGAADLASNGTEALAVSIGGCGTGIDRCVVATRVPMNSEPPAVPVVSVPATRDSVNPTVASNGSDYLVAWSDPFVCFFTCGAPPNQIYAVRLRRDGTALDAAPMLLDNAERYPSSPTIAWGGGRYLVVWLDGDVRATRVTPEGAVLDRDAEEGGVLLASANAYESLTARAMALDRRFALLIRRSQSAYPRPTTWEGIAFAADADLGSVASMPRTVLLAKPNDQNATLAAAARDGVLALAYDRLDTEADGGVSRAFLRLFAPPVPRRHAAGR